MGLARSSRHRTGCRAWRWRRALPVLALTAFGAADASAHCVTRTCQLDREENVPCPRDLQTGCYTEGAPVYWGSDCLSYAIQRDGSIQQGITAEQVASLVEESFRIWSDVSCARGGTPPLTALSQGPIACAAVEFNCKQLEQNSNLIVFRDDFQDTENFYQGVIALTNLTANTRTGQIFSADIEINSRDEDFVIGEPPPGSLARDLRGVLNHEIGHLLGLSHSKVSGALMLSDYRGTLLPAQDDITGMCEIRSGKGTDPECSVVELAPDAGCLGDDKRCKLEQPLPQQDEDAGCACALPAARQQHRWGWAIGLMLACWLRRRVT
jgi:hypothetical protein